MEIKGTETEGTGGDRDRAGVTRGWGVGGSRRRERPRAALDGGGFSARSVHTHAGPAPARLFAEGSQLCGQAAPGPAAAAPCT